MTKKILTLILYYFLATVIGSLVAAFFYMVACDLTLCVAGEGFKLFCTDFFVRGILVSFPLMVSLSLGLIVLYGIRHRKHPVAKIITYVCLCAFTWLLLIPCSFDLSAKWKSSYEKSYEVPYLSSGYFRQEAGGVFYFSRVYSNGTADGLFIDLTGITGEKGSIVKFNNSIIDADFSGQFADTLIRDAIKLPFVVIVPIEMYSEMMEKAASAWHKGYVNWLVFVSFALLLCSVIVLDDISMWRLLDVLAVLFSSFFVILFNYAYYHGLIFVNASKAWAEYFSGLAAKHSGFLAAVFSSDDIMISVINFGCFIVLAITGIILFSFHKKNNVGA